MIKSFGRTHRKRKKKNQDCDDKSTYTKYYMLCKWMGEKNYKPVSSLRPKTFIGAGYGLMTLKKISKGDIIISIPEHLLISPEFVLKTDLGKSLKKFLPSAPGHQILSVFLAYERLISEESKWNPYIHSLPDIYDIPAFYGQDCLPLFPLFLKEFAEKQVQDVKESYEKLFLFLEYLRNLPNHALELTFDLYKWAWCTVNTRCVYMNCLSQSCIGKSCTFHMALAPYLDLLNHSIEAQVKACFNKETNNYEIVSLCNFKKHSQVFINYGPHDNRKLLIEYGFIVPHNHYDSVSFSFDEILISYQIEVCSQLPCHKIDFISQNNLVKEIKCSHDGISWNMNLILQILCSQHDVRWWSKNFYKSPSLNEKEETKFKQLLKAVITVKLNQYTSPQKAFDFPEKNRNLHEKISQLISFERNILKHALLQHFA